MRLATACRRRQWVPFVCGVALGLAVAALDLRTPAAWLQQQLAAALFDYYEYDYDFPWLSSKDVEDGTLPPVAAPRPRPECNHTIADSLKQRVRVLCWVMTAPENHRTKAATVNITWGQHCNKLLFMTTEHDPTLPTVALNVTEGRRHLWSKTKAAFKYIVREGLLENFDWVLKADDDTFFVMQNLRHILLPLNASKTIFLGLRLKPFSPKGYMSGGAGYVLSRMAALRLVREGLSSHIKGCINPGYNGEDVAIGRCMVALNAIFMDSRDSDGLERFHALNPEDQIMPQKEIGWMKSYSYYDLQPDSKCCSPSAVSFHYIKPAAMRAIYYLVYRLKPYGLNECELPTS